MDRKQPIVERAFELADGFHRNVEEIQTTLRREGYESVSQHFTGLTIRRQMVARIKAVRMVG